MNGKRMVLGVVNGSPSTSSNLFQAAKMNRSTPMIIQVFGYLYGVLQDSFFVYVRQVFKLVRLPMASGISMFREGPLHTAASLCHRMPSKLYSTSMSLSSFDKGVLEHVQLSVQFEHSSQRFTTATKPTKYIQVQGKAWFFTVFNSSNGFSVSSG